MIKHFQQETWPQWGTNWYRLTQAEYEELYETLVYGIGTPQAIALAADFNYIKDGYHWAPCDAIDDSELELLEENGFVFDYFPFVQSQFPVWGG